MLDVKIIRLAECIGCLEIFEPFCQESVCDTCQENAPTL